MSARLEQVQARQPRSKRKKEWINIWNMEVQVPRVDDKKHPHTHTQTHIYIFIICVSI